jgi:hypothetical protein
MGWENKTCFRTLAGRTLLGVGPVMTYGSDNDRTENLRTKPT